MVALLIIGGGIHIIAYSIELRIKTSFAERRKESCCIDGACGFILMLLILRSIFYKLIGLAETIPKVAERMILMVVLALWVWGRFSCVDWRCFIHGGLLGGFWRLLMVFMASGDCRWNVLLFIQIGR